MDDEKALSGIIEQLRETNRLLQIIAGVKSVSEYGKDKESIWIDELSGCEDGE